MFSFLLAMHHPLCTFWWVLFTEEFYHLQTIVFSCETGTGEQYRQDRLPECLRNVLTFISAVTRSFNFFMSKVINIRVVPVPKCSVNLSNHPRIYSDCTIENNIWAVLYNSGISKCKISLLINSRKIWSSFTSKSHGKLRILLNNYFTNLSFVFREDQCLWNCRSFDLSLEVCWDIYR